MTEEMMRAILSTAVRMTCLELTVEELSAQYRAVLLNSDPRNVIGYEKISSLYTENDGTGMHGETKSAFIAYAAPVIETAYMLNKEAKSATINPSVNLS